MATIKITKRAVDGLRIDEKIVPGQTRVGSPHWPVTAATAASRVTEDRFSQTRC